MYDRRSSFVVCRPKNESVPKKKKVPSDLSNNSASFRHARLKLRSLGDRSYCPFAPRPGFCSSSDQRSTARQSTHSRSEPAPRDGLSLSRRDCPLPGLLSKVNAPRLSLRFATESSPNPFDPAARPRCLVSPRPREFHTADPLPGSLSSGLDRSSCLHSRSGLLDPSRSKRQLEYQPRGSPNRNARSPFAPRCLLF